MIFLGYCAVFVTLPYFCAMLNAAFELVRIFDFLIRPGSEKLNIELLTTQSRDTSHMLPCLEQQYMWNKRSSQVRNKYVSLNNYEMTQFNTYIHSQMQRQFI